MKKYITATILFMFACDHILAQNIGIGTSNPVSRLHIFTGASGNITPMGPLVVEGSTPTYISILTPDATLAGLAFGNPTASTSGAIVYNSSVGSVNSLLFRTNGSYKMAINAIGNVGIGVLQPSYRLQVSDGTVRMDGPSAFGGTVLSIGGFGDVQVDANGIVGGRFIIKENGLVGVGTNNPGYQLDVANRMRLRSGGTNVTSAGIWLNNNANVEEAFMGMEDNTHVGFFGGPNWKFSVNTQTGAYKVNGSEGNAGNVLQSNGPSAPASWVAATNTLYNNTVMVNGTGEFTSTDGSSILVPGLTYTFTCSGNVKVLVNFTVYARAIGCSFCGSSQAFLDLNIDGSLATRFTSYIANAYFIPLAGSYLIPAGAGTHTIQIKANTFSFQPNVTFGCASCTYKDNMILQVIQQ
jgi:hypothetical protein